MTSEGIRAWFLRDVLDSVERRDDRTLARLGDRLPERLARWLEPVMLRSNQPADLLPLDEGEELLLAIDATVGDGSGRVLEQVAFELATRMLLQMGSAVVVGDLQATMARIRASLERPYTGVEVGIELTRTDTGFTMNLRVPGRPRAARLLRHVAVGTLRGAHRFCREAPEDALKVFAETIGDRAHITVRLRTPEVAPESGLPASIPPPVLRRPSRNLRAVSPLSEEVERIMGQALRPSVPPAPRRTASHPRIEAVRPSQPSHIPPPPPSMRPRRPTPAEEQPAPSAPEAASAPRAAPPPGAQEPDPLSRGKR